MNFPAEDTGTERIGTGPEGVELPTQLREELERRLPEPVRRLPPEIRERTIQVTTSLSLEYLGSIPPGFLVAEWEKLHPGAADRILRMSEIEQAALIRDVDDRRRRDDRFRIVGLVAGASLIAAQFSGAVAAMHYGFPWVALAFLGAGVGGVLVAFLRMMHRAADPPENKVPSARETAGTTADTPRKPSRRKR